MSFQGIARDRDDADQGKEGKLELGRVPGGLLVSGRSGSFRMVESGQGCHSGYIDASL